MNERDDISKTLGIGEKKKRHWGWIGVGGAVLLALAVFFLIPGQAQRGNITYNTEPVGRASIQVTVSATGTVEPTDLVEISSELSGTVKEVFVDFNDAVEVGTLLARLDTTKLEAQYAVQQASLASAEAQIATAKATLAEAKETYERGLTLEKRGVETSQTLTSQKASYERAKAELIAAEAARDLAEANLDLVQVDIDKSSILSPVAGVVLDRDVDTGQTVAASLTAPTLFQLAEDLAKMELQVDIDEADIGRVAVGQSAVFTVDAYDERAFPAEISELRFASETVDGVVTYMGILTLDNSDLALRPGMTANADIVITDIEDALVVPNAALRYSPPVVEEESDSGSGSGGLLGMVMPGPPGRDGARQTVATGKSVWVLRDGEAVEVAVETGDSDGSFTAILGGDLAEGDAVITDRIDAE